MTKEQEEKLKSLCEMFSGFLNIVKVEEADKDDNNQRCSSNTQAKALITTQQ